MLQEAEPGFSVPALFWKGFLMNNFEYFAPTKVVFGKGTEKETGRLAKEFGARKVLVH